MLTLKIEQKCRFDKIASGEQKEVYKEAIPCNEEQFVNLWGKDSASWKNPQYVTFEMGERSIVALCTLALGEGYPQWGAVKGVMYYIIRVQKIVEISEPVADIIEEATQAFENAEKAVEEATQAVKEAEKVIEETSKLVEEKEVVEPAVGYEDFVEENQKIVLEAAKEVVGEKIFEALEKKVKETAQRVVSEAVLSVKEEDEVDEDEADKDKTV